MDGIDPVTRHDAVDLADNWPEVSEWYESLEPAARTFSSPGYTMREWRTAKLGKQRTAGPSSRRSPAEKLEAGAEALKPSASEDARRQAAAAVAEAYGVKIPDQLNRRIGGRIPTELSVSPEGPAQRAAGTAYRTASGTRHSDGGRP